MRPRRSVSAGTSSTAASSTRLWTQLRPRAHGSSFATCALALARTRPRARYSTSPFRATTRSTRTGAPLSSSVGSRRLRAHAPVRKRACSWCPVRAAPVGSGLRVRRHSLRPPRAAHPTPTAPRHRCTRISAPKAATHSAVRLVQARRATRSSCSAQACAPAPPLSFCRATRSTPCTWSLPSLVRRLRCAHASDVQIRSRTRLVSSREATANTQRRCPARSCVGCCPGRTLRFPCYHLLCTHMWRAPASTRARRS
mmetsp:Transcript_15191/g.39469  ORF Transcript_15191/g.39469 Transcript_15191/m.39469 type:complete len:255 (+) Transcript_15191:1618-2382(+)